MNQKLESIKNRISLNEEVKRSKRHFAGAGLIICNLSKVTGNLNYEGCTVVYTQYASELSALVEELRDAMVGRIDYLSKYSFYPMLGEAANAFLKEKDDLKGLLLAVIDTAIEFEGKLNMLYFAYGSNMDQKQMEERCSGAKRIGKGILRGYKFALDEVGVATVTPQDGSIVEGVLWEITPANRDSLDIREGVKSNCYRQSWLPVEDDNGETPYALVYISERPKNSGNRRKGYLNRVITAAKEQGLSEQYIKTIEKWTLI